MEIDSTKIRFSPCDRDTNTKIWTQIFRFATDKEKVMGHNYRVSNFFKCCLDRSSRSSWTKLFLQNSDM